MPTYQEVVDHLLKEEIIVNGSQLTEADIYKYENDDLRKTFHDFFNFCIINLRTKCGKFDIQPASIYFERNFQVNAKAGESKENYVISINMGLITVLYPFFTDTLFDFNEEIFSRYETIEKNFDSSPEFLMFQLATQFTYYHEQAHLIQKSDILKTGFLESYQFAEAKDYSLEHHLLEIDADLWSAHFICYHLIEYFEKQTADLRTNENLISLFILGLSSILSYFIFLMGSHPTIYFKEKTHPHASIRISYIIDAFLSIANATFKDEFEFDQKYILSETFKLSDAIFKMKNNGINDVNAFLTEVENQMNLIKEYITEMQGEIAQRPNLLLNNLDKLIN